MNLLQRIVLFGGAATFLVNVFMIWAEPAYYGVDTLLSIVIRAIAIFLPTIFIWWGLKGLGRVTVQRIRKEPSSKREE